MTGVRSRHWGLVMILAVASLVTIHGLATDSGAVTLFGLSSDGRVLVQFDSGSPGTIVRAAGITGLPAGEVLRGIDVRPATGELYGLGVTTGATDTLQLYWIDPNTGVATAIGSPITGVTTGTSYGVDFNPVPDRLRVVNNGRENLRVNPNTGARADVPTNDTDLTPPTPVVAVAYDRNFAGTAATTLFGIETTTNTLVTIGGVNGTPSPNGGTINPVGGLGVIATGDAGFDIDAATGTLFVALTVGGQNRLYSINPATGSATLVGPIGDGTLAITGLTAVSNVTLTVSPGPGTYGTTQSFDILLILNAPNQTIASAQVTFDGVNVTPLLLSCFIVGLQTGGGVTVRCPDIRGSTLGTGTHTLVATVNFASGGSATASVVWTVVQVTEP